MSDAYSKTQNQNYPSSYFSTSTSVDEAGHRTHLENTFPGNSHSVVNRLDGFRNPRWKQQIRLGQNATTHLSGTQYVFSGSSYFSAGVNDTLLNTQTGKSIVSNLTSDGSNLVMWVDENVAPPSNVITRVSNRAKAKFLDRCSQIQSSIEAGQDFGEIKETLHSVLHPMQTLRESILSYLSKLRKLKFSRKIPRHSLPKVLSDTYLEYHFGWAPLVDDVAQYIADIGRYRYPFYPVEASASETFQGDSGVANSGFGYFSTSVIPYLRKYKYGVKYKGMVRSGSSVTGQISFNQSLRLEPKDWLPTAWDLIPYSWVVDYFTNVGEILQALAFVDSSLAWGCQNTRFIASCEVNNFGIKYTFSPPAFPYVRTVAEAYCYGGNYKIEKKVITRDPFIGSDLLPAFSVRIPTSKYPYFNMGAILSQSLSGLVPFF